MFTHSRRSLRRYSIALTHLVCRVRIRLRSFVLNARGPIRSIRLMVRGLHVANAFQFTYERREREVIVTHTKCVHGIYLFIYIMFCAL